MHHDDAFTPVNVLEHTIWQMHERMSPEAELDFVTGLRAYAERGECAPTVAACAGCDIRSHVDASLSRIWRIRYSVDITFPTIAHAERDPRKRLFLENQFPECEGLMCVEVASLGEDSAANVRTTAAGVEQIVPWMRRFGAGFTCSSRTPLSSKMQKNVNCVQSATAATGMSFRDVFAAVRKNAPQEVLLECVRALLQKVPGCEMSDADFITEELRKLNMWACHTELEATHHGSPVPRDRVWWSAVSGIPADLHSTATHTFHKFLRSSRLPNDEGSMLARLKGCFTLDDDLRRAEALRVGFPLLSSTGAARLPKLVKGDLDYKLDHYQAFNAMGLAWPPKVTSMPCICHAGMLPRESEVVYFLNSTWPKMHSALEFIDVNQSLPRILSDDFAARTCEDPGPSPWRSVPPTLVGSMKFVLRAEMPNGDIMIRCLEGFEYFRLLGWGDSWFCAMGCIEHGLKSDEEFIDVATNLAGNAWSGYQYAAVMMAQIAVSGLYSSNTTPAAPRGVAKTADDDHQESSEEEAFSASSSQSD